MQQRGATGMERRVLSTYTFRLLMQGASEGGEVREVYFSAIVEVTDYDITKIREVLYRGFLVACHKILMLAQ